MNLRPRLALTTFGVSIPLVLALITWDLRERRSAAERELQAFAEHLLEVPGWLAACEAGPARWTGQPDEGLASGGGSPGMQGLPPTAPGGHGPGNPRPHDEPARFYAYDSQLQAHHPSAPVLDAAVIEAAQGGRMPAAMAAPGERVRVLLQAAGSMDGCAYVLADGTTAPWLGAVLPPPRIWLLPLLVVIAAVLVAVGPVIRRIRDLTAAVERSAASDYLSGVHLRGHDEVAELARAFDGAASRVREELAEAQRRGQALRDFLANTTHDVMIPLTVLQGHLAALQEQSEAEARATTTRAAMDEAHYLGALLHNLGAAAKLEAGTVATEFHAVDLGELVARACRRHRLIAQQREVSLEHSAPQRPLVVHGDVTMLEQAVSNLVYNAIRHNRPGGHVAVLLEPEGKERFELRVLDDGPGIPADELSSLTARGFRGSDARTRAPGGQGLGLHITAQVAQRHGFQFTLRAAEGGGLEAELGGPLSARPLG